MVKSSKALSLCIDGMDVGEATDGDGDRDGGGVGAGGGVGRAALNH